jgi:peptidoglycan hydrolase CwlO-like protein
MKHVLKALNKELQSLYDEQKTDKSIINKLRSERAKLETEVHHLKSEKHTLMQEIERLIENK